MNVRSLWQTWHQQLFGRARLRRSRMPRRSVAGRQCSGPWAAEVQVLEGRTLLSSIVVTNVADSGAGTLRQAILDANAASGADEIDFNIDGTGVHTIAPLSQLPNITDPVVINGYSQAGSSRNTLGIGDGSPGHNLGDGDNAVLTIELDGSNAGSSASGLVVCTGNSTIEGLVINRFGSYGVAVFGLVATNDAYFGTINPAAGGNTIAGNFIGTDVTGMVALGNGGGPEYQFLNNTSNAGILLASSPNNTIGGLTPGERNIISGNAADGIVIEDSFIFGLANGNQIQGNLIGTDASGTVPLGNASNGIALDYIFNGGSNTIGGSTPGARNVIAASLGTRTFSTSNNITGTGIAMNQGSGTIALGNFIGTDITGTDSLGNKDGGISVVFSSNVAIGGATPGTGNLIAGNGLGGVAVGETIDVRVQGNFIGTDVTGTIALNGQSEGIYVYGQNGNLLIGGTTLQAGNLISGNTWAEVDLRASNITVQGNFIGTDVTGTVGFGGGQGLYLGDLATHNLIGGTTPGAGNLIAGDVYGISLNGAGVHDNTIQGNRIGTDVTGGVLVSGSYIGVIVQGGANSNIIGGTGAGEANIIRSGDVGALLFDDSVGNSIRGNRFGATIVRPIALGGGWGTAPNDPLDVDTGPNELQNHPVITNGVVGTATHVTGVLDSSANAIFAVDFYSGTDLNQTLRYIGTTTVSTDAAGNAAFDLPLAVTTVLGETLFATATNAAGSTSDMSPAAQSTLFLSDISQAKTVSAVEGNSTGTVVLATFLAGNSAAQAADFTVGVNWGGALIGTPTVSVQFVSQAAGVSTWQVIGSATYSEAGLNPVIASVSDVHGGSFNSSQTTISVADAPLTDTTAAATLNATADVSTGSIVLATFTDGNPYASATDYTTTVDFGGPVSGTPTASIQLVSRTATVSTWQVIGNVMYASAGSYTVTVTVNDADGGSVTTNKTHAAVAAASSVSILLLDASGQGALTDSGNGKIIVGGHGEIVVASTNAAAIVVSGNGSVTASEIDVESSTGTQVSGNGRINGVVDHGVSSSEAVDPLAALVIPAVPTTQFSAANISGNSVVTLQPGKYNGGIQISGNAHVTLAPGIYYLNGGGFSVTGNAFVSGTGVFIYSAAQTANDSITISGNASVNLSAQMSGVYKGIVLFQARTSTAQIYISGNATVVLTGTLYAAKAKVNVSGNGLLQLLGSASELIAGDLIVSGNGIVKVNA